MAVLVCKKSWRTPLRFQPRSWFIAQALANVRALQRATEMEVTIVGLQNAGKTSLLRVLAVSSCPASNLSSDGGVIRMRSLQC